MAFKTEAELRGALAGPLQQAVDVVTDRTYWKGEQLILSTVYSIGNNGYERTYQFLDAWITNSGGGAGIASGTYEYNPAVLSSGGTPVWNFPYGAQHQSVLTGDSSAGAVADYIYLGHGGIWSNGGRNAFKKIEQWLLSSIVSLFARGCRSAGLVVVRQGGYDVSGLQ